MRRPAFFLAGMAIWSVKDRLGASAPAAVLCTLPLAAASWFAVERPAMKARHWRSTPVGGPVGSR